ncbi:hypothetical protein [Halovenus salina]|uniref:Sulfatase n=1 Tax=Halovenus salina TaxID=1510225 RepID=A0ABD5VXB4_9EURY|nr:hypothetical protein [Halovenus salina]
MISTIIPERYNLENLSRVLRNPSILLREPKNIKRDLVYYPNRSVGRWKFHRKYGEGIDIMEHDWDNLIILDACRYDFFEAVNWLEGSLNSVVSRGSHSRDFVDSNFRGRSLHDTVYVSGNVKAADLSDDVFHKRVLTYSKTYSTDEYSAFKERYERYSPEAVYELAVQNYHKHEDKRFIVHFMQPHCPYLGEKAEQLRERLTEEHGLRFKAWESLENYDEDALYTNHLLSAFEEGYGTREELEEVYEENLELVLEFVANLLEELEGKTVITADHGELLGDPTNFYYFGRKYAHIKDVYIPELRVVPWLKIEGERRREITAEDPLETDEIDPDVLDEQLEALGYI